MKKKQLQATNEAIRLLGGLTKAAKHYRITVQAVQNWRERGIPARRVKRVEKDTGVARARLLPDLYG